MWCSTESNRQNWYGVCLHWMLHSAIYWVDWNTYLSCQRRNSFKKLSWNNFGVKIKVLYFRKIVYIKATWNRRNGSWSKAISRQVTSEAASQGIEKIAALRIQSHLEQHGILSVHCIVPNCAQYRRKHSARMRSHCSATATVWYSCRHHGSGVGHRVAHGAGRRVTDACALAPLATRQQQIFPLCGCMRDIFSRNSLIHWHHQARHSTCPWLRSKLR